MPKLVNLSNGDKVGFPDEMSWEQIESVLQKQFPPENINVPSRTEDEEQNTMFGNLPKPQGFNKDIQNMGMINQTKAKEGLEGLSQGYLNSLIGMGNLLPKVNIKKFDYAPHTSSAELGEDIGDILSFFTPGGALKGIAKASTAIPMIGKALKSTMESMKSNKILNTLGKTSMGAGEAALFNAANADNDNKLNSALEGAGLGGGVSLGTQLLRSSNPVVNALSKLGIGAGIGYGLGGKTGAEYGAVSGLVAPRLMKEFGIGNNKPGRELLENIRPEDVERAKESINIGVPLSPGEASGRPDIGKIEGRYRRWSPQETVDTQKQKISEEKNSINNLLNKIHNNSDESNNKIMHLYKESYNSNIDDDILNKLRTDPDIDNAIKKVRKDYTLNKDIKDLPDNSLAVLDQAQRYMQDRYNTLMKGAKPKKNKARIVNNSRDNLISEMDNINPSYKEARQKSQLKIVRENIKKSMKGGKITGTNFFKNIVDNEDKYNNFYYSLKNAPEAQKHLKIIKDSWENLSNPEKYSQAKFGKESGVSQSRNYKDVLSDSFHELMGTKVNSKAVKYLYSPEWIKDYEKIGEIKNNKLRKDKLADMLGRVFTSSILSEKEES